jgi:SPP1 family predicted phage head-tail adaptor
MAIENNGAGQLTQRVAFERREEVDRGDGVTVGQWKEQFKCWAGYKHLRGGETVQAARLQGQQTLIIRVRSSSQTKGVTSDWRIRDTRTGALFDIKNPEPENNRMFISFTCQSGGASG